MGRARLHPCRHSPPKLSFRAVRSRACAGRTSEESAFGRPVHYEPIFLHREIRIRARLQPCRQVTKSKVLRRYGATTKKLNAFMAVAPDRRVGQYWTRNGTAEADALTRTRSAVDSVDYVRRINAAFISARPVARCTPPPMLEIAGIRLCGICRQCFRWRCRRSG